MWRGVVQAVVALPLVLPPTVLGFYLLVVMGPVTAAGATADPAGRASAGVQLWRSPGGIHVV